MANWSDRPPFTSVSDRPSSRLGRRRTSCVAGVVGYVVAGLLTASAQAAAARPTQTEALDHILAVVDGYVVMHSDVRAFIELGLVDTPAGPDQEADVLTYLIERRLVLDRVDRFVVAEPSSAEVDRRLDEVRQRSSGDAEMSLVLERVGLTLDDLRQVLADEIRRETYLNERFAAMENSRRAEAAAEWVAGLVNRAQVRRVSSTGRSEDARDDR